MKTWSSSLTNGVDGNSSDSSLASKSGNTKSNVANKSSKHHNNNNNNNSSHNNHHHNHHHHNHSNGAVEPPRSISRDRLSDASTHSGSNQGYVVSTKAPQCVTYNKFVPY
ncbi:hypothetical protein RRG08_066247 [Elysia crispata]|uniref:Uncharacterized protein n=1 Tax=Elysia crispata TaxID=231223 RepID=A0AAE1BEI5_9GAST|nr:hypothetical protein RRG08_066247 [Elysia crispata]